MPARGPSQKAKRRAVEYDADTPRCQTCKHFRKTHHVVRNGAPMGVVTVWCHSNEFPVRPAGLCNAWQSRRGETLDSQPTKVTEK